MSYRYLYYSPRGFSNEDAIYRVRPDEVAAAERFLDSLDYAKSHGRWITAEQARRWTASERRQKRANDRLAFGRSLEQVGATEIQDWPGYGEN
jgi:hypothetical protein